MSILRNLPTILEDLNGRRILVTGASTGIGAAAAIAFAHCGARVALHFNRSEKAAQNVADAISRFNGTAILLKGDLSQQSEPRRVVEEAVHGLGGLDVLVNNAGSLIRRAPFYQRNSGNPSKRRFRHLPVDTDARL